MISTIVSYAWRTNSLDVSAAAHKMDFGNETLPFQPRVSAEQSAAAVAQAVLSR
jgi:hypothetical protein